MYIKCERKMTLRLKKNKMAAILTAHETCNFSKRTLPRRARRLIYTLKISNSSRLPSPSNHPVYLPDHLESIFRKKRHTILFLRLPQPRFRKTIESKYLGKTRWRPQLRRTRHYTFDTPIFRTQSSNYTDPENFKTAARLRIRQTE